uniref:Peptidase S1 domain-containing protein n=1 Tax=Musca domestica TaxID=7370 RepID=A0A1I8MP36_MUSDO
MKLFQNITIALVALFATLAQGRVANIGKQLIDTRVIGGNDVPEGAIPFQVSIQNTFGEHICGGSIIAPEWILTAAHCMEWPKQYLKIVTGTVNWTKPDAEYFVKDVKIHCLYDQPMYHNDIALIKLAKPIVYNEKTKPVELATSNLLKQGDKLVLSGWGSTKLWGRTPDILQSAELDFMEHEKCSGAVRKAEWLGQGNICTDTSNGKGSCHNDSGGPLYDAVNKVLVGIVNWGQPCAAGYPDVFASVAYYHDWILTNMAGSGSC